MFEQGGILYVYFIYGMHWCANIVTEEAGKGRAVLLRAAIDEEGQRIDGPARLTKALGWNGDDNYRSVLSEDLSIYEDAETESFRQGIVVTPRIGITKAADRPLRFVVPPAPGDERS
jgi:DNA-3-methyladenine glycosylase